LKFLNLRKGKDMPSLVALGPLTNVAQALWEMNSRVQRPPMPENWPDSSFNHVTKVFPSTVARFEE